MLVLSQTDGLLDARKRLVYVCDYAKGIALKTKDCWATGCMPDTSAIRFYVEAFQFFKSAGKRQTCISPSSFANHCNSGFRRTALAPILTFPVRSIT